MDTSRRNFIKNTGLGLSAAVLFPHLFSCESSKKADGPFANVGLQLFTLRDQLAQDAQLVLKNVSTIGYSHVETFGVDLAKNSFWNLTVPELKKILDDNNLKTHSGHYDMSTYLSRNHTDKENIEHYIEIAHELGQKYVVAPVTPMFDLNNFKVEDYQYAAEQLNKAGEMSKKAGIKIAYHNHFWEFRTFPNGTRGLDILLAFTEPDLVDFELDLFWIERSGLSPQSYFEKFPNRFPMWHLKDIDKKFVEPILGPEVDKEDVLEIITNRIKYTEVGTGTVDFINIAQEANKSGLQYAFVEQDMIYSDDKYASIKKSYDYVQKYLVK
ncbi:sugar phosphate isomerase/epimerase family protein [Sphingobacterium hungaricum]|uniref:Sugar phosphate isomerase/epimerase n=1 Tax=Sphingobacterium hungaricum TaxID=2082723 RepID=A0A928YRD7_9SPHI|nr:sugar phosphate isomerase/epimerase [Sphingobacterium hungaricum]MBE8713233.1 sugar phosphate isomerase/epimerase [Sphingobacterium hungaricum]